MNYVVAAREEAPVAVMTQQAYDEISKENRDKENFELSRSLSTLQTGRKMGTTHQFQSKVENFFLNQTKPPNTVRSVLSKIVFQTYSIGLNHLLRSFLNIFGPSNSEHLLLTYIAQSLNHQVENISPWHKEKGDE